MYAYEAAAGVLGLATTEDIDLLFDFRGGLTFVANDEVSESSLLQIIKRWSGPRRSGQSTVTATWSTSLNRCGILP